MKKKVLSLLLVGAMLSAILTGCGGGSDASGTADNSSSNGAGILHLT